MSSACSRGIAFILEQNGALRTGISFLRYMSKKGARRARNSLTVSLGAAAWTLWLVIVVRIAAGGTGHQPCLPRKVTGASPVFGYSRTREGNVFILLVSSSQLKKVQINSANKG